MTSKAAAETVQLPWVDEPVELAEAVEMIARADEADEDAIESVSERVERLERRVDAMEDGTGVECPACGESGDVYKSGVGAARLANQDALDEENARALDGESHVCLGCRTSFTPARD